jgi:K+-sensing histidine kinase KdpD
MTQSCEERLRLALDDVDEARAELERVTAEKHVIVSEVRAKNSFLARLAHELRSPLNAIIGFSDLLASGAVPADSPKHEGFLVHIKDRGHQLLQLINDVLDLSRVELGELAFSPEPLDLRRLIESLLDVAHTPIMGKRLNLAVDVDSALTDIVLDPVRLKQALFNCLSSAINGSSEGGHITISARGEGADRFILEVQATSAEFVDDGETQTAELESVLIRRLAKAQGGKAGVRKASSGGKVFFLELPRAHHPGQAKAADPERSTRGVAALPEIAQEAHADRTSIKRTDATALHDPTGGGEGEEL